MLHRAFGLFTMRMKQKNTCWKRIERILAEQKMSTNALAKQIGLLHGENLYQIKRGNNRISIDVARRIHTHFPQYAVSWLLTGEEECVPSVHTETVQFAWLPYYESITENSSMHLSIPTFLSRGARMILRCGDLERCPGFMPRPVLLLRRVELSETSENNSYYILTDKLHGVFTVRSNDEAGAVRLESIWDTYTAEVPANDICGVWLVCNIFADMV